MISPLLLSVCSSLLPLVPAPPQLPLTPLRVTLRHPPQGYHVVRPNRQFHKFFPTAVQLEHELLYSHLHPHPGKPGETIVGQELEAQTIPFSMLEDMRREMLNSEAVQIIEKGSKFVQALR